ncbi:MAG: glycine--tRNA ligase, partial [Nanoarchaeota archaeon]
RKGFVYPSGEIYGGLAGFWDFGEIGVELKNNIKKEWWKYFAGREDVVGIDGAIITHPQIWKASGHVDSFSDVFVICKKCKKPSKIDKSETGKVKCDCGGEFDFDSAKDFKLMFETNVGEYGKAYLRPETAQLIFSNFKLVYENSRSKLPFGIAQIGKAFRNEIAPRDFLFRSREFEQMEMQFFVDPEKANNCSYYDKIKEVRIKILGAEKNEEALSLAEMLKKGIFKNQWHAYWLYYSYSWFLGLGISEDNLRLREHEKKELAHYAKAAVDIEYKFPSGWREIFGSHDRGQFDLGEHEKFSKKDLKVFDEETKKRVLPQVVESSFGVERAFLAFMFDAYCYDPSRENIVLKLDSKLAPVKVSVFPIVKKPEFENLARKIYEELREEWNVSYDISGSIGRRYSRNDEIGTPYCITIDGDSILGKDVTIRDRNTKKQVRAKISELKNIVKNLVDGKIEFEKSGKLIN